MRAPLVVRIALFMILTSLAVHVAQPGALRLPPSFGPPNVISLSLIQTFTPMPIMIGDRSRKVKGHLSDWVPWRPLA